MNGLIEDMQGAPSPQGAPQGAPAAPPQGDPTQQGAEPPMAPESPQPAEQEGALSEDLGPIGQKAFQLMREKLYGEDNAGVHIARALAKSPDTQQQVSETIYNLVDAVIELAEQEEGQDFPIEDLALLHAVVFEEILGIAESIGKEIDPYQVAQIYQEHIARALGEAGIDSREFSQAAQAITPEMFQEAMGAVESQGQEQAPQEPPAQKMPRVSESEVGNGTRIA